MQLHFLRLAALYYADWFCMKMIAIEQSLGLPTFLLRVSCRALTLAFHGKLRRRPRRRRRPCSSSSCSTVPERSLVVSFLSVDGGQTSSYVCSCSNCITEAKPDDGFPTKKRKASIQ